MIQKPLEIIEYKSHKIEIWQDEMAESPDTWENADVFLVYQHRHFTVERKGFYPRDIFDHTNESGRNFFNGYHVFQVNAYIHGEVTLSLGKQYPFDCKWDVSTTGFALVKRQKGWSWTREKARKIAEELLKEWNQYFSGDVYGYDTEFGGCWGFYGEKGKKQMIEEAKAEIDYVIDKKKAEIDKLQYKLEL